MPTSIPQVLWCLSLRHYDVEVFLAYDSLFQGNPKPPFTQREGECPIRLEFTLYVDGVPYPRTVEDRLVVRKDGGGGVQSFSVHLNQLYQGSDFLHRPPGKEGNSFLRCVISGRSEDFTEIPTATFWLHAQRDASLFIYPASQTFGNPKASPYSLRAKFCEHFPAIVYEPEEDLTTAVVLVNPQNRETKNAVRLFPPAPDGGNSEVKLRLAPHSARLLPLHECFPLQPGQRNTGLVVLSDHKQVVFSVHMDLSGERVFSVDHTDPWRATTSFTVPVTQYWRRKVARALSRIGLFNYHGH